MAIWKEYKITRRLELSGDSDYYIFFDLDDRVKCNNGEEKLILFTNTVYFSNW